MKMKMQKNMDVPETRLTFLFPDGRIVEHSAGHPFVCVEHEPDSWCDCRENPYTHAFSWWTEGNGSCDCNRSGMVLDLPYDDFWPCGDTIKLTHFNGEPVPEELQ